MELQQKLKELGIKSVNRISGGHRVKKVKRRKTKYETVKEPVVQEDLSTKVEEIEEDTSVLNEDIKNLEKQLEELKS